MKKASGFLLANWSFVLRLGLVSIASCAASAQPALRGQFSIAGEAASRFVLDGNFMHVATRGGGQGGNLKIVDIADLQNPSLISSTFVNSEGIDLALNGNFIYYGNPARAVDISNKLAPAVASQIASGSVQSLTVEGGRLYVGNYGAIQIFNVQANPGAPGLLGAYEFSFGWAKKAIVRNNLAYAVFFKALNEQPQPALRIIDVTDPEHPTLVGQTSEFLDGGDLAIAGNYAYVSAFFGGSSGLAIYDISNPVTPREVYRNNSLPGYLPSGVAVRNGIAAVSGLGPQVHLFNVQTPANASRIGDITLPASGRETDVVFHGDTLAVSNGDGGIRFYDISNPASATLVNAIAFGGYFRSVQAAGNYGYVLDAFVGLRVIDVSNPGAPQPLSVVRPRKEQRGVILSDDRLYLYSPQNGVEIYSLANPSAPQFLAAYAQAAVITDIAAVQNTLFVADSAGVNVLNIADPSAPATVTRINEAGIVNLEVSGSHLAAQTTTPAVVAYNIANAAAPVRIGQVTDTVINDISLDGSQLYYINTLQLRGAAIGANGLTPNGTYAIGNYGPEQWEPSRAVVARNSRVYVLWDTGYNRNNLAMWDARAPGQLVPMGNVATASNGDLAADGSFAYVVGNLVTMLNGPTTAWFQTVEGVLPTTPSGPTLTVTRSGSEVHIRWPTSYTGFGLYTKVGVEGTWQLVTSNPPIDGSDYLYVNRFPLAEAQFYRLVK